jgi:hypothetical protein
LAKGDHARSEHVVGGEQIGAIAVPAGADVIGWEATRSQAALVIQRR